MKNGLLLFLLFIANVALSQKSAVVITRDYRIRSFPETATIVLDWNKLNLTSDFEVVDGAFQRMLSKKIVDDNNDNQPDRVVIEYTFPSDEAVYSFYIKPNNKLFSLSSSTALADPRLKITYLKNAGTGVINWPDRIIESAIAFNPNPNTYDYGTAYFLTAMINRYKETQNQSYLAYVRKWADQFIDSHGSLNPRFYRVSDYNLDDLLPGRIFISLFEITKDARYKGAAQHLRHQLQYQPRTSDGGYWNRQSHPYQMWLDGLYMSSVFSMQYSRAFNDPAMLKDAMQQIQLVQEHNGDPETGLLYHGWDESGNRVWANEDSGTSPEFWSRGIAWYYLTLLDCIEYVPLENLERKQLGMMFRDLTKPIQKFEDPKTALWYQVINKSYEPRNWFETSASAMFAYAFAKGFNKGILDKTYLAAAQKTFATLQQEYIFTDDQGRIYFDGTAASVTLDPKVSKGDLDYYVSAGRKVNDYKGLGALLYLSMELD